MCAFMVGPAGDNLPVYLAKQTDFTVQSSNVYCLIMCTLQLCAHL